MAKPYDVVMKEIVEYNADEWMKFLGLDPQGPVRIVDADLSTVVAEADKVVLIDSINPEMVHLEFQSNWDAEIEERVLRYNVIIGVARKKSVRSFLILMRRSAEWRTLTGVYHATHPNNDPWIDFHYNVVRLWLLDADTLMQGDISLAPLTVLSDIPDERVEAMIHSVEERLLRMTDQWTAAKLMEKTVLLSGLRLGKERIAEIRKELTLMSVLKDSSYYQLAIEEGIEKGIEKGKIEQERRVISRLGELRFGEPEASIRAAIEAIDDIGRLERIGDRIIEAKDWNDLIKDLNE